MFLLQNKLVCFSALLVWLDLLLSVLDSRLLSTRAAAVRRRSSRRSVLAVLRPGPGCVGGVLRSTAGRLRPRPRAVDGVLRSTAHPSFRSRPVPRQWNLCALSRFQNTCSIIDRRCTVYLFACLLVYLLPTRPLDYSSCFFCLFCICVFCCYPLCTTVRFIVLFCFNSPLIT